MEDKLCLSSSLDMCRHKAAERINMKLGVFSPVLAQMSFKEMVEYLSSLGVDQLEMGAGGYPGKAHFDPEVLLADDTKIEEIKQILDDNNMSIAAISCHGNPVHPNKKIADEFHKDFENAVLLAEKLGVTTMVGFSGCPGDCETSTRPNWITCSWPNDYLETLDWQWNEVLIPYWKKEAEFCKSHGIEKIAFEMHPGFCVYNTSSLLKLRKAVGDIIGANVDPSHLLWQGMDPVEVIKVLGKENAIHHFHAKDTKIDSANTSVNGVLDVGSYADLLGRSWVFRTVGYGNGKEMWNNIISTLKAVGYEGVISIEHEDALMSPKEGLEKAIAFLKDVIIYESPAEMWWI